VKKEKEELTKMELTMKDHRNLLLKKQELVKKIKDKEAKEKEISESKEVKEKKIAVKDALEEVRKAEALVKEDMAKGKDVVTDKKMESETKRLENLVKTAL